MFVPVRTGRTRLGPPLFRRECSDRLAQDRPQPLGRGAAGVAEVDLVVLADHAQAVGRDDLLVHPGEHGRLVVERPDVQRLHAQPFRQSLETHLGVSASVLFGVALLASGLSSSSVGTLAGQVVMQGFVNRRIPLFLRRFVTMVPALVIIAAGADPSRALVLSQVVLSFGIPFALVPLLLFCRNRELMGALVNRRLTTAVAVVVATVIISLNAFLLEQTFVG